MSRLFTSAAFLVLFRFIGCLVVVSVLAILGIAAPAIAQDCNARCCGWGVCEPLCKSSCELEKTVGLPPPPFTPSLIPGHSAALRALADSGDPTLRQAARNADEFVSKLKGEAKAAIDQALDASDQATKDAARNLVKSANDIVDAAKAVGRFAERQVGGYSQVFSAAQRRIREGKVADAIWHIGTGPAQNTNKNAAQLMQENELVAQAAAAAATAYGGPAGAAAFAAWKAYNESGGNIELAIKAGAYAYVVNEYGNVDALPGGTAGEVAKKAAATGAIAGLAVAASGGSTEESLNAFVRSGGAVLVQGGQAYVEKEYAYPAMAEADLFCQTVVGEDCATADDWYDQAVEYADAAPNNNGANLKVTSNGEWAISWNKTAVNDPATKVPAVVLTYVGKGSPYFEKFQKVAAIGDPAVSSDSLVLTQGWIYLGRYRQMTGEWDQPRSDDLIGKSPEDVKGAQITLSTGVNLRSAMFKAATVTDTGCDIIETPIIGGLEAGSVARVLDVVRFEGCTSYVWAQIER
ncbi:hypothetical protein EHH54_13000 [Rhizobium leguminosarum]|uniref:hypothetical protein n=1 Tax=Rhizobium leguminosarum TaxID=384 RepID=UPI000FEC7285|nr:hypothetical protein [Rhizobium leguminosarum]RWX40250.1 hypothetical protein EHH54_13000 [Rhizobium leguminosarum]